MAYLHSARRMLHLILIPILLALSLGSASPAASQPLIYTYANGVQLAIAGQLPVFHVVSPLVTVGGTQLLTQSFSNIYSRSLTPQQDTINNHARFSLWNETNNTVLEQCGATGGFYAYNPDRAFSNTMDGTTPTAANAQMLACQFLNNHQSLVSSEVDLSIPGLSVQCDHDFTVSPLYKVSTEWLTGQTAPAGNAPTITQAPIALRMMVTVPIMLDAGFNFKGAPVIPLAGPGGHISMIFFNPTPALAPNAIPDTLDPNTPGLQAVAMPGFGRSFTFNRNAPTQDPAVVQALIHGQLMAAYPDAKNISIPTPALEYYMSDASTPQLALEPVLNFPGISLDTGGHTLTLKDITLPATIPGPSGLGPTVDILSPTNGSFYLPGGQVTLQGRITNGTPPFSYDWQFEDGTSLKSGIAAAEGLLPLFSASLPVPVSKGSPSSLAVRLLVTDSDGITRQGEVSLSPPLQNFLPSIAKGATTTNSPVKPLLNPAVPTAPNYVHTFGVEYGSDYPPYGPGGPDLGGVPPDANGLSSGLWSLGYSRVFNWYNASAWEKDWRDCSLGGGDCSYGVDRAEYVYYSGHGSNGGISIPSNSHDSNWFDGINARYQNARWVGFSSCLTLRAQGAAPTPITRWFNAFQGAHLLMGFNSTMGDIAFGGPLVDNMRMPTLLGVIPMPWAQRTIAGAWVQTAFEMNAGKPAYIYAWRTGVDPSTDKLPSSSLYPSPPRPYPVMWYYWVWWDE